MRYWWVAFAVIATGCGQGASGPIVKDEVEAVAPHQEDMEGYSQRVSNPHRAEPGRPLSIGGINRVTVTFTKLDRQQSQERIRAIVQHRTRMQIETGRDSLFDDSEEYIQELGSVLEENNAKAFKQDGDYIGIDIRLENISEGARFHAVATVDAEDSYKNDLKVECTQGPRLNPGESFTVQGLVEAPPKDNPITYTIGVMIYELDSDISKFCQYIKIVHDPSTAP